MACGRALSTHRGQWDCRRHSTPQEPARLVQRHLQPPATELALVKASRRGLSEPRHIPGGWGRRACHPRRQVQGRPSSPRGTWLQSEAPSRVPAHDRGWARLSPSDAPWGLSPTMAGVHQAPRDPRLEGGRGGDTSARHSPFPLEGSFSSKMTRCPSRLDIGAPRSRGSFSPLYKDSALSHSDRNFSGQLPVV